MKAESKIGPMTSLLNFQMVELQKQLGQSLLGCEDIIELSLASLLSSSHVLLEGAPGVGKTSLAKKMASMLGGTFSRVQMTSDMLPSDIVGVLRPNMKSLELEFREGPIFANFVLADEVNRCSPRTQSALLEAMAEGQVSVDSITRKLPQPFFVFATQNPEESLGVYPLSESQLDRFALHLLMKLPSEKQELELLKRESQNGGSAQEFSKDVLSLEFLKSCQLEVTKVYVEESLLNFMNETLQAFRKHQEVGGGVSVRAGIQWVRLAKALAWIRNRDFVKLEDLRDLVAPLLAHRIVFRNSTDSIEEKRRFVVETFEKSKMPF